MVYAWLINKQGQAMQATAKEVQGSVSLVKGEVRIRARLLNEAPSKIYIAQCLVLEA